MTDKDQALLEAFNSKFGQRISEPETVKRLLGSPHVRHWYADYKAQMAQESSLPDQWKKAGLSPSQWQEVAPARAAIRRERAAAADEIARKAAQFQKQIRDIEQSLATRIEPQRSPLVRVIEAGVNDLPLAYQIQIETGPADKRADRVEAAMEKWRSWAVTQLNSGEDPFRG